MSGNGHFRIMLVYKILRAPEWAELRHYGVSAGAPIDLKDGYVHLSTAEQVRETCKLHFEGAKDLMLLALEAEKLAPLLRWEPSRGGELFPHLYRSVRMSDIAWHHVLALGEDGHVFPDPLE